MSKRNQSGCSPAEDYLKQVNPDRPFRNQVYRRFSNTRIEDDDGHYHILLKRADEVPDDPLSLFYDRVGKWFGGFFYLLIGSVLVAVVYVGLKSINKGETIFLPIFVIGGIFLIFVVVAVWDGTKPTKRRSNREDKEDEDIG